MLMKEGDLFFKATESIYNSWRTVLKYRVFHYTDKTKLLAVVVKKTSDTKDTNYVVIINNVTCDCKSLNDVLKYIIEYYE